MDQLFTLMNQNSEWLFGGSSFAAILITIIKLLKNKSKKPHDNNSSKEINISNSKVAGRDVIINNVDALKVLQIILFFVAFLVGFFTLTLKSETEKNAVNNMINSGDNSTNVISNIDRNESIK